MCTDNITRKRKLGPRVVKWNEAKEINKAMLAVAERRVKRMEWFPHSLLHEKIRRFKRLWELPRRIRLTIDQTIMDRAMKCKYMGLFGTTNIRLEDAIRRMITIESYRFSDKKRERILINSDLSNGSELFPISVYSDVLNDTEGTQPDDFEYITMNKYPQGFLEDSEFKYFCNCEVCDANCPCIKADQQINPKHPYNRRMRFTYDIEGHSGNVHESFYQTIRVLCGPDCACGPNCEIGYPRAFEASNKFEVFKRDSSMGFGLRVLNNVMTGEFLTEFVGEVWVEPEPYLLSPKQKANLMNYSYSVCPPELVPSNGKYGKILRECGKVFPHLKDALQSYTPANVYIMPFHRGNVARYISHGCMPNAIIMRSMVNDIRPEACRLYVIALEDIPAGSEIFIDYGPEYASRFDCSCGTPLCEAELPYLTRIMEGTTINDIWRVFTQRSNNIYALSLRLQEMFSQWELARSKGDPDPEIGDTERTIEPEVIESQVQRLVNKLAQPDRRYIPFDDDRIKKRKDLDRVLKAAEVMIGPEVIVISSDDEDGPSKSCAPRLNGVDFGSSSESANNEAEDEIEIIEIKSEEIWGHIPRPAGSTGMSKRRMDKLLEKVKTEVDEDAFPFNLFQNNQVKQEVVEDEWLDNGVSYLNADREIRPPLEVPKRNWLDLLPGETFSLWEKCCKLYEQEMDIPFYANWKIENPNDLQELIARLLHGPIKRSRAERAARFRSNSLSPVRESAAETQEANSDHDDDVVVVEKSNDEDSVDIIEVVQPNTNKRQWPQEANFGASSSAPRSSTALKKKKRPVPPLPRKTVEVANEPLPVVPRGSPKKKQRPIPPPIPKKKKK